MEISFDGLIRVCVFNHYVFILSVCLSETALFLSLEDNIDWFMELVMKKALIQVDVSLDVLFEKIFE